MKMFPRGEQVNSPQHRPPSQVQRIVTFLLIVTLLIAGIGIISSFGIHKAHAATTWTPVWSEDFNGGLAQGSIHRTGAMIPEQVGVLVRSRL